MKATNSQKIEEKGTSLRRTTKYARMHGMAK
jgi:hypothetical protein